MHRNIFLVYKKHRVTALTDGPVLGFSPQTWYPTWWCPRYGAPLPFYRQCIGRPRKSRLFVIAEIKGVELGFHHRSGNLEAYAVRCPSGAFAKARWGNDRKLILSANWQEMVLLTSRVTLVLAKVEGRGPGGTPGH